MEELVHGKGMTNVLTPVHMTAVSGPLRGVNRTVQCGVYANQRRSTTLLDVAFQAANIFSSNLMAHTILPIFDTSL